MIFPFPLWQAWRRNAVSTSRSSMPFAVVIMWFALAIRSAPAANIALLVEPKSSAQKLFAKNISSG